MFSGIHQDCGGSFVVIMGIKQISVEIILNQMSFRDSFAFGIQKEV